MNDGHRRLSIDFLVAKALSVRVQGPFKFSQRDRIGARFDRVKIRLVVRMAFIIFD